MKATQNDINNYVLGTITIYPLTGREQLEAMVILHYDIPDKKVHYMVGKALLRGIEIYSRKEITIVNELRNVRNTIDKLRQYTPEFNPSENEEGK